MLSFQIKKELKRLLESFDKAKYFFDCLESIDSTFPTLNEYIQDAAAGGDKANNAVNQLRNHLAQTRQKIVDVEPRRFFSSIEMLQTKIKKAKEYGFNDLSQLDEIESKLDTFSRTYEKYIKSYSPQSAGNMVVEARLLSALLDGFRKGLEFYLANIESEVTELEEGKELSIVLPSTMTLSEFIDKLRSIKVIYDELCMLTGVSSSDYPIQIIKIESGSLWAKVFGNSKVIALLTSLIESGAGFVYRNATTEGKLVSIPRKVESVESVLELSKKLKAQGIDVEELNDRISKSSVMLAKELNRLISGQPEIVINNSRLSISDEIKKKLIETNAPLKLEFDDGEE